MQRPCVPAECAYRHTHTHTHAHFSTHRLRPRVPKAANSTDMLQFSTGKVNGTDKEKSSQWDQFRKGFSGLVQKKCLALLSLYMYLQYIYIYIYIYIYTPPIPFDPAVFFTTHNLWECRARDVFWLARRLA